MGNCCCFLNIRHIYDRSYTQMGLFKGFHGVILRIKYVSNDKQCTINAKLAFLSLFIIFDFSQFESVEQSRNL